MMNREKRDTAADSIQRVLDGKLAGSAFLDEFPRDKRDPALAAIYERLWLFFDDRRTQLLSSNRAVYGEVRRLLERCRDFLRTDLEYDWPSGFRAPVSLTLLRLMGMRSKSRTIEQRKLRNMAEYGDLQEWPFRARHDGSA